MRALFRRSAAVRGPGHKLFNWFVRARDSYFAQSRPKFEATTLGLALLLGLLVMPLLIYVAGRYTLKEYANGGLFALFTDYCKGLVQLRPSCWIVLIGPLVLITLLRLFRLILRKL
jgi:hypothetical protein